MRIGRGIGCACGLASLAGVAMAGPTGRVALPDLTRTNTSEVIVKLTNPLAAELLAQKYALAIKKTLKLGPEWVVYTAYDVESALRAEARLKKDPLVEAVSNNYLGGRVKAQAAFTPNDAFYLENNPAGFFGCWHLAPNPSARANVNAQVAWSQGMTGEGVSLVTVDDGLDIDHPDLSPNINPNLNYNFADDNNNPSPVLPSDNHGTACAGVAGARGGNTIGVCGAAPKVRLGGYRLNFAGTAAPFIDAIAFYSSGEPAFRQVMVKSHSYVSGAYGPVPLESAALKTSTDAGTLHAWAAGNARGSDEEDANKLEPQNHPGNIVVAALGSDSKFASYSSFGQNVFVTAPSSGDGVRSIMTTDRVGNAGYNDGSISGFPDQNYNPTFGGTSSATPLVAGVLALLKQRCPALDQRLAKHLMVKTNRLVDEFDSSESSDGGWKVNGAGNWFNPNYGFGLIDAGALVTVGKNYYSSLPRLTRTLNGTVNAAIPDSGSGTLVRTFTTSATVGRVPLEEVSVRIRATHPTGGQLVVYITSPTGVKRRLNTAAPGLAGNLDWTYVTYAFWGEDPIGTWRLEVADQIAGGTGTWTDYQVTMGFGAPGSRLGSGILSYNPSNTSLSYTALWNSRNYATQALPVRPATGNPKPVATGDLNRDGRNDILYQNADGSLRYQALHGYTAGNLVELGALNPSLVPIGIGDINRDSRNDIVVRHVTTRMVSYLPLDAEGLTLGTMVNIGASPAGTQAFAVADSTGDGQVDILLDKTTTARAVWIWQLNNGGTPFGFIFSGYQATGFSLVGVADLNFDGQPDFVARNTSNGSAAGYTMNILTVTTISTLTTLPAGHTLVGGAAL